MNRYLDLTLKIIAWSLMLFAFALLILKWLKLINSPTTELLAGLITAGLFLELGRLEERTSTFKSDFRILKRDITDFRNRFNSFESRFNLFYSNFEKQQSF